MNNSEIVLANQKGRLLYTVCALILFIAYALETLLGRILPWQFAIISVTNLLPVIAVWVVFQYHKESLYIKHIIGIGFGIFYAVICFMSKEPTVFIYAIPMLIAVSVYCDVKFSVLVSSLLMIVVFVHAGYANVSTGWNVESVSRFAIEVGGTLIICIFSIICNQFIVESNNRKMSQIDEASKKAQELVDNIMEVSNTLANEVNVASEKLERLEISSKETLEAMHEVQAGTGDSAEAVQNQLYKTEEITKQIGNVTTASVNITNSVHEAVEAIHIGRDNIHILNDQVLGSEEAAAKAVTEVEELKESTSEMGQIVDLITNIARQTSLLALNASIEAARAGEYGRGFSVVAKEISNLAAQTQTATKNINDLIANLTKEMGEVSGAILTLVDNNKKQNDSVRETSTSFEQIVVSTRVIRSNAGDLANIVAQLEAANNEIAESIQTISAITEEVNAHSANTCNITEDNQILVREVQDVVGKMILDAEKLKKI